MMNKKVFLNEYSILRISNIKTHKYNFLLIYITAENSKQQNTCIH